MFGDANCRYLKSENWIASNRLAIDKNIQNKHLCKENINIIKGSKLTKKNEQVSLWSCFIESNACVDDYQGLPLSQITNIIHPLAIFEKQKV